MALWLFKNEPSCYSFADLERDGSTVWDGVTNALAQKHLRSVKPGDKVLFYHTGDDKAIVGTMTVSEGPAQIDDKNVVVQVRILKRFKKPVTLAAIKAEPAFAEWDLVKNSRLSVMPVSAEHWKKIEAMAK